MSVKRWSRRMVASVSLVSLALSAVPSSAGALRLLPASTQVTAVYVAVGASESVGFQPSTVQPQGVRTPFGYASVAASILRVNNPGLVAEIIGCPGATSASALAGDHCSQGVSQVQQIISLANAYPDVPFYVSLDLGFNDLRPCREAKFKLSGCVESAVADVRINIATFVTKLRSAIANPLHFVGLTHDDPFLVSALMGGRPDLSALSIDAVNQLNRTLNSTYPTLGIPEVDVAALFSTGNTTTVTYPPFAAITAEQARVCDWTWMCAAAPFGPNIHMNDAGYAVVADAVVRALRSVGLR